MTVWYKFALYNALNRNINLAKISINNILLSFVIIFLFLSSLSQFYFPSFFYQIGLVSTFLLMFLVTLKKFKNILIALVIFSYLVLNSFSIFIFSETAWISKLFPIFIMIYLSYLFRYYLLKHILWLKIYFIINLYALIWEKINLKLFLSSDSSINEYEYDVLVYGQGLNLYTKGAAEMVSIGFLFFRNDLFMKFLLFFSSIMIGVRSAIAFIFIIIFVDFLFSIKPKNAIFIIAFIIFSYFLGLYLYQNDLIYLGRISSLFNFNSATYIERFWIVNKHLDCYFDLPFFQQIFGSGMYCSNLYQWGSENYPIQILTWHGFIAFLILMFAIIMIVIRMIEKPLDIKNIYVLLLFIFVSLFVRTPNGWFGGTIFYSMLYLLIFNYNDWRSINKKIGI